MALDSNPLNVMVRESVAYSNSGRNTEGGSFCSNLQKARWRTLFHGVCWKRQTVGVHSAFEGQNRWTVGVRAFKLDCCIWQGLGRPAGGQRGARPRADISA